MGQKPDQIMKPSTPDEIKQTAIGASKDPNQGTFASPD